MLTIIVTAHQQDLTRILNNIKSQTVQPKEVLVYYSECQVNDTLQEDFIFSEEENKNDWGHDKRAKGLTNSTQEYITFWNADDYYDNTFVEKMLIGNDVTFCGWSTFKQPVFRLGSSTSGNYIVKTDIARKAGYNSRVYEADGILIEDIKKLTDDIHFVDECLYYHNK